ncbi:hypothetical protein [Burkholderia sp. L27(2015)]|uniref:hypothetical protein n=1 Tax=Burkholderia sp. L27(2015) TaxID=1641858 RepID=UPI00131D05DE|nr:hypothetical protein [Burkholderia sp. L27(2015)]
MLKSLRLVGRIAALMYFLFGLSSSYAGQLEVVSVTSSGFGTNAAAATVDAVRNGVASVNGESIASSQRLTSSSISSTDQQTQKSRTINDDIQETTHGVVKSWRTISTVSVDGGFQSTVQVGVVVLRQSAQLDRIKLAVVPSHTPTDELTGTLVDDITANLVESRKFAILDRQQNEAIGRQLAKIRSGTEIEDLARLSSGVAPDDLAIVTINSAPMQSGATQVRGEIQVIDYSSRQVKFAEQKSFTVKSSDTFPIHNRLAAMAKTLSRDLLQTIYPPLVVGDDSGVLTIAQGSNYFNVGDKCSIKEVDGALRDPYTKEFLGYKSADVGTATITYTDSRISQATLDTQQTLDTHKVAARKYQVWRIAASADDMFKSMSADMGMAAGPKKAKERSEQSESDY